MSDYDIFRRFPDGSSVWQLCVNGRYNTQRKLQELAEAFGNEYYAVDLSSREVLSTRPKAPKAGPAKKHESPNTSAA